MDAAEIKYFIEAALLAAGRPLSIDQLVGLFDGRMAPKNSEIRQAIVSLNEDYEDRGMLVAEVASGFRMQLKTTMADRLQKLWEERPPRYSRALFETLALVAYRQPITRGDIEEIRGVAVSSNIVRQLLERDWVRVVGHRDVPGRPAMFGTTKSFLDYFGLKKLDDLPPLADLSDWESLRVQLDLPDVENEPQPEVDQISEDSHHDLPALLSADFEEAPGDEEMEAEGDADAVVPAAEAEPESDSGAVVRAAEAEAEGDSGAVVRAAEAEEVETGENLKVAQWPDPVG